MILVTGANGNLGSKVIERLQLAGLPYRKAVKMPDPKAKLEVAFDFLNPATFKPAVESCEAVFLMRPPATSNTKKTLNKFIDVARKNGVRQFIFISVAGANPMVPHYAVEQHLRAGPRDWTILRPDFFMQNLEMAYLSDIRDHDEIYVPAADAQVRFVDASDVAEVAGAAISSPNMNFGQTYTLSGPQTLSFAAVAAVLSVELGRPIHYRPATIVGYIFHLALQKLRPMQIIVQTILHLSLRFKTTAKNEELLSRLLGHKSNTMEDYVRGNRDIWQRQ